MTAFKLLYEEEDEEKTDANSTSADGKVKQKKTKISLV